MATWKYKKYIYKRKEDSMGDIMAEDVQEAIQTLKETVGGMGQWTPADLKLLPITACERLAQMFNAIGTRGKLAKHRIGGKSSYHGQGRRDRT